MSSLSQVVTMSPSVSGSIPASAFTTSSSLSPSSFSSPSPSSSPTSDDDDSSPSISRESSLLFGFLITFLALFVGFMACGYSSRRAAHIRRAGANAQLEDAGYHRSVRMKKPHIWDVWIAEGPGKEEWKDMMPLSASLVRPKADKKRSLPSSDEITGTPPALRESGPPQEYFPSYMVGSSRGFGRLHSSPPLPLASRSQRSTSRLTSEPSIASLVLPSTSFALPPLPDSGSSSWFSSRARNRNRNINSEAAAAAKDGSESMKDVHARISVLIAMPSPTPISSPGSAKPVGKSISEDGEEIVEESKEGRPRGDYEIGVARVRIPELTAQNELQADAH